MKNQYIFFPNESDNGRRNHNIYIDEKYIGLPTKESNIIAYKNRLIGVYDEDCIRFDYSMVLLDIVNKQDLVIQCNKDEIISNVMKYMNLTEQKWINWANISGWDK